MLHFHHFVLFSCALSAARYRSCSSPLRLSSPDKVVLDFVLFLLLFQHLAVHPFTAQGRGYLESRFVFLHSLSIFLCCQSLRIPCITTLDRRGSHRCCMSFLLFGSQPCLCLLSFRARSPGSHLHRRRPYRPGWGHSCIADHHHSFTSDQGFVTNNSTHTSPFTRTHTTAYNTLIYNNRLHPHTTMPLRLMRRSRSSKRSTLESWSSCETMGIISESPSPVSTRREWDTGFPESFCGSEYPFHLPMCLSAPVAKYKRVYTNGNV